MTFADMRRAVRLYPGHRHNQLAWLRSIAYLRSRGLYLLDGAPAKWGYKS